MRNRTFDLFKWAAALFVLLLHVPFPGDVGGTVRMFARWAVPFFFMVSGYFTYGAVQRPAGASHAATFEHFCSGGRILRALVLLFA